MSRNTKSKEELVNKSQIKGKTQKPNFLDWLIYGTGSVSEPWPTTKEVLQNTFVQKNIQKVKEAFNAYRQNKNKNN